jgi:hypothetical protein
MRIKYFFIYLFYLFIFFFIYLFKRALQWKFESYNAQQRPQANGYLHAQSNQPPPAPL